MFVLSCVSEIDSLVQSLVLQSSMREIADLQQQLSVKEAELTRAQETIEREQQQNQELREQV